MPMPKTLISSINSLWTWKNWTDLDADSRRGSPIWKETLLHSGMGTPLQWYNISKDIPHVRTISRTHRPIKWIPIANIHMLRCGLQIDGGKRWLVSFYCQSLYPDRACHRECVRGSMSETTCWREHVRENVPAGACQGQHVRVHQIQIARESELESVSERVSDNVSESVRSTLLESACQSFSESEWVLCQLYQHQCWPDVSR